MNDTSTYGPSTPYFLPAEIVRAIAKGIDSKNDSDALDNKCQDLYLSRNELNALIEEHIYKSVEKLKLKKSVENEIKALVAQMFDDYLKIVATYNLSERTREDTGDWIIEAFFCPYMINIIYLLGNRTKPFQKEDYTNLMRSNASGMEVAFSIIEERIKNWDDFYRKLSKDDKDKITSWRRGENLPSLYSLYNIFNPTNNDTIKNVLLFLKTARAIEYFKNSCTYDVLVEYMNQPIKFEDSIRLFNDSIAELQNNDLQYLFNLRQSKDEQLMHRISTINLELLTYSISNFTKGELELAKEYFIKAFDLSLYRFGQMSERIIEVGLVIASWQEKPDMVLISKLKSVQNLYGYTLPTVITEEVTRKKETQVEDWEINMWRSNASKVFAQYNVKLPDKHTLYSACLPVYTSDKALQLDLKKPNKKVKLSGNDKLYVDKGRKKYTTTQLVWRMINKDLDAVKQLLEAGANINQLAENNESALSIALQHINLTESYDPDDRFYKLVKDLDINADTANAMSPKKHIAPLTSAVQTGQFKVVDHILNLGADVNKKTGSNYVSPLIECLSLIECVKNPSRIMKQFKTMRKLETNFTQNMSDSDFSRFIRDTQGSIGLNRQQVADYMVRSKLDSGKMDILNAVLDHYEQQTKKNYALFNLVELREIFKLLLDNGADPNAIYNISGIDGYTSFLLACECDEAELVNYMLSSSHNKPKRTKANIDTVYRDKRDGRTIGYEEVCKYFGSSQALEVVKIHNVH